MSDPRFTDPRYSTSQLSDPVGRRTDSGGTWGWIAGIVVIALIALFLIVGGKNTNTASNTSPVPPPGATAPMPRGPAPSTTGMGSPSQFPSTAPSHAPATTPNPSPANH